MLKGQDAPRDRAAHCYDRQHTLKRDKLNDTVDKLLTTVERCRRLSSWITDRKAIQALLQLTTECDERAVELREQADKRSGR